MRTFRLKLCAFVVLLAACSRETPAPPAQEVPAPSSATIPASPPPAETGSAGYDDGVNWLRSAESFRFTIRDGEVRASGELKRETVGAESVTMRVGNDEWRAAATPSGVTWEKNAGGRWEKAAAPDWGHRLYQRVTLAFDPQKKEGQAQLVETEDGIRHYRFTDANTGNIHDVWIGADRRVERMTIGDTFEMTID